MRPLPERNLTSTPWYNVAIDFVRPWSAETEHFNSEFYALTWIHTTTNLVELVSIDTTSTDAIVSKL